MISAYARVYEILCVATKHSSKLAATSSKIRNADKQGVSSDCTPCSNAFFCYKPPFFATRKGDLLHFCYTLLHVATHLLHFTFACNAFDVSGLRPLLHVATCCYTCFLRARAHADFPRQEKAPELHPGLMSTQNGSPAFTGRLRVRCAENMSEGVAISRVHPLPFAGKVRPPVPAVHRRHRHRG